jgi:hypothetical protein
MKGQSFIVPQGLFLDVDENTTDFLFSLAKWVGIAQILLIPIDFFYRQN